MSAQATTAGDYELPSATLARSVATAIPMLLLAYTVLIWPLLYAEPVYTSTFAYSAPDAGPGSFLLTKIYIPALFVIALLAFANAPADISPRQKNLVVWLGIFLALGAASTLWSLDGAFTLKKAIYQTLLCATVAMAVFTARDPRRILLLIFGLFVVAILANLFAVATRPPSPIGYEGIYDHKNTLGSTIGIAFMVSLYVLVSARGALRLVAVAAALACIFLLVKSESKTALGLAALAPLCGTLLYLLARWLRVSPLAAILFGLGMTVAVYFLASRLFGFDTSDVLLFLFNDATFTGRTQIWAFVWDHIKERPLLGHGYQGFWGIPNSPKYRAELPFIAKMAHGHNGILDTILNSGVVGLVLYLILIAKILRSCGNLAGRSASLSWFYIAVMFYLLCSNLMESLLLLSEDAEDILFLLVGFLAVAASFVAPAARPLAAPGPSAAEPLMEGIR